MDVDLAAVAAVIGDPSRATMLDALMAGPALTASELAHIAGIGRAAASEHLSKLTDAGLVEVVVQGRHRYHRIARPEVGQALEALSQVAPTKRVHTLRQSQQAKSLAEARSCYDHLAGRWGVTIHDALIDRGVLVGTSGGYAVSDAGRAWFDDARIDLGPVEAARRQFARPCLDWTERRPHLAGGLGAVLLERFLSAGWFVRRASGARGLRVTDSGVEALAGLGIRPEW